MITRLERESSFPPDHIHCMHRKTQLINGGWDVMHTLWCENCVKFVQVIVPIEREDHNVII